MTYENAQDVTDSTRPRGRDDDVCDACEVIRRTHDSAKAGEAKEVLPLVAESGAMAEVARRVERAAEGDSPVLISGERGTGKKRLAETIHRRSRRGDGPLVIVHTGRIADWLLEEELWGSSRRRGGVAKAAGGTLLIEEITELPPTCQARLLETAEGRPVAGSARGDLRQVNFRLMATTRFQPSQSVQRGAVRADLYYRLAVVTIDVPPLRRRREDIPALVERILAELSAEADRPAPAVTPDLMCELVEHDWPGNVGQLRGCLEAMLLTGDASRLDESLLAAVCPDDQPEPAGGSRNGRIETLAELERAAVVRALKIHQGNRSRAARSLGISVRTLQRKLREWGS